MATYFNDLSNALFHAETLRPQSVTGATDGVAVDVAEVGANLINARLAVGAVNTLTGLTVTMQASPTGSGDWVTCKKPNGDNAVFTTVTAANATEVIAFQLPTAASASASPYRYVRAQAAITGTSALTHVCLLALKHLPDPTAGYSAAPPTIN